ncbi:hypothetical protein GCM10027299_25370 [Larkinella ripae]
MNAEIKTKWLAALRSGEYQQAQCALRVVNLKGEYQHCCLGVLADLIDPKAWQIMNSRKAYKHGVDGISYPSQKVLEKADLAYDNASELADMNDCGQTFLEIADYIETNF